MANFIHYTDINGLFKKKNEQVWQSRNRNKLASPTFAGNPTASLLVKPKKLPPLKLLISAAVLFLLLVGGVSAMVLSQIQQDVRQQASGCTYWNGEAATEGSYDNRGGIRQQCEGGYWSKPDDGILDPRGMFPEEEKTNRGCRDWTGADVPAGVYDNRGGIRQQCVDGLWTQPDDGITDPNDTSSLELVGILTGLDKGEIEYSDARKTYDQYCRANVHSTDVVRCKSLEGELTTLEANIRYGGLNEAVVGNTEAVSSAIGGLDDRTMGFNEARSLYREYCEGAKAQQTSSSACKSLKSELDEIETMRDAAETARYTALTETVQGNTEKVSYAIGGLDERTVDFNEARSVYTEYCQGAKAQQTSGSACSSLKSELDEIEAMRSAAETAKYTALTSVVEQNTTQVTNALGAMETRSINHTQASAVYTEYCQGAKAQQTSGSACQALNDSIVEVETLLRQSNEAQNTEVTTNTNSVNYAISAVETGVMDAEAAQDAYDQHCVGAGAQRTSSAACASLNTVIAQNKEPEVVATVEFRTNVTLDAGDVTEDAVEAVVEEEMTEEDEESATNVPAPLAFFGKLVSDANTLIANVDANYAARTSADSLDSYQSAQNVFNQRCGEGSNKKANQDTCNNLQKVLTENQPIMLPQQVAERTDTNVTRLTPLGFIGYHMMFNYAGQTSIDEVTEVIPLSAEQRVIDLAEIDYLQDEEFSDSTIIACDLAGICQVMNDGVIEIVSLNQLSANLGDYGLTKEQEQSLQRNGYLVTHWTDGIVRGTGNEANPFEIRVCASECEWVVASDENIRLYAGGVLNGSDKYDGLVPDMNGDGYILDNDVALFLANSSTDTLLELVVRNDSNWSDKQVSNLMDNYNDEFYLSMPNRGDLENLNEVFEGYSARTLIKNQYGFAEENFPEYITYTELNQVNKNVQTYFALDSFSQGLSSLPIIGTPLSNLVQNFNGNLVSCQGNSTVDADVCIMQEQIVKGVDARNGIVGLSERTGIDIVYSGDLDYGTMRSIDTAFELMPSSYYEKSVRKIVFSDEDEATAGYTDSRGNIQLDVCELCVDNERYLNYAVHAVVHEVAHNLEETNIPAGNYCVDNGTCIKIDEQTTGRDLIVSIAADQGLEFTPTGYVIIAAVFHDKSAISFPQYTEGELGELFFEPGDYAFSNMAEFYAETLSSAISYPEAFAAASPDLYAAAVLINGFETESYINEFGEPSVRRKES